MTLIKDTALELKERVQNQDNVADEEIQRYLAESKLIPKLLVPPKWPPTKFAGLRTYLWRLTELSEIPYVERLDAIQDMLKILLKYSTNDEGFSLRGTSDGLTACHNSMITTVLIKLNYPDQSLIRKGIDWILKYQMMGRNQKSTWKGTDLYTKWGGCMKATPCFYGVVKATLALSEFSRKFGETLEKPEKTILQKKLEEGLNYILSHNLYQKLSNQQPIEDSIISTFYPFPYRTNLVELLHLMKQNNLLQDPRCNRAIELLRKKKRKDGYWQVDKTYMKSSWVEFDIPKHPGLWVTNFIREIGIE